MTNISDSLVAINSGSAERGLEGRIDTLTSNGVIIHDRRQTFIADDVRLDLVFPGAQLFPGCRIQGAETVIGPNTRIGSEGPVTLIDSALGDGAEIASGFVSGAALLKGARLGSNAHVRPGTILEEFASTAHAVGLKQTILMSFVTFGSLINFCDAIVSGGRSRREHTEVGSGHIHFNYTPWGLEGDKATPTIVGDVREGVFLNSDKIFLGGLSGTVGPTKVGFGSITAAGSILRKTIGDRRLVSSRLEDTDTGVDLNRARYSDRKVHLNLEFIDALYVFICWYKHIRMYRAERCGADAANVHVLRHSLKLIDGAIEERKTRLNQYLKSCGRHEILLDSPRHNTPPAHLFDSSREKLNHVEWVASLTDRERSELRGWLASCALARRGEHA